jgi:hypothetical protein
MKLLVQSRRPTVGLVSLIADDLSNRVIPVFRG